MLHFLLEAERRRNAALGTKNQQHVETTTRLGGFSFQHRNVLHYACMCGSKPMIQYLLTQGFDAQDADANGTTCLELAKQRHLPWLEDFLTGDAKVAEPPTHMRKTRPSVAICHGTLLLSILATNYWLVWWLALPLIMIVLFTSLLAFRQKSHGSGGHSHSGHHHGEAPQNFINMHPSSTLR